MWDFLDSGYAWDFLFAFVAHAAAALAVWAVGRARRTADPKGPVAEWVVPSFAVSVAGLAVGVLAGSSRVYEADLVVPVVLLVFVGFGLWLYSRAESRGRLRVLVLTAVFSFCVLVGTFSGWAMEDGWDGEDEDAQARNVMLAPARAAPSLPAVQPSA